LYQQIRIDLLLSPLPRMWRHPTTPFGQGEAAAGERHSNAFLGTPFCVNFEAQSRGQRGERMVGGKVGLCAGIGLALFLAACAPVAQPGAGSGPGGVPASTKPRGYMGLKVSDVGLDPSLPANGLTSAVRVDWMLDGSPGAQAGLQEGDLILTLNGKPTDSDDALVKAETEAGASATVALLLLRDGHQINLKVTLAPVPADAAKQLSAYAAAHMKSEQQAGTDAETAGDLRAAFDHDVRALRFGFEARYPAAPGIYDQILGRVPTLVGAIKPPPSIPAEADRRNRRAIAIMQTAANPEENDRAAEEFGKAIYEAPWLADLYLNSGLVLEKAGYAELAIYGFRRYLILNPTARDVDTIKQKLAELEVLADERKPWLPFVGTTRRTNGSVLTLMLRGRNLSVTMVAPPNPPNENDISKAGDIIAQGTIHGRQFQGKTIQRPTNEALIRCFGAEYELDADGTIDSTGTTLTIRNKAPTIAPQLCQTVSQQWEVWGTYTAATPQ
jgi:tetratricopeptide (TPR) repeat protein